MSQAVASPAPLAALGPSRAANHALSTVAVLFKRDLLRLLRQKSRLAGALGQPLIFWLVIGGGFAGTFRLPGSSTGYLEYFFPGVVVMVVLFTSIFGAMSLIEDRREGFLQAVLAAPGPRASVALGKVLGGASVAWLQAMAFVALAPLAGFPLGRISFFALASVLALAAAGLAALGFALAWRVESTSGYHAVVSLLLVPLWVGSGAMFPATGPVLGALVRANPVAYLVDGARQAFYGGPPPPGTGLGTSLAADLAIAAVFASVTLLAAAASCRRR
ncbi:MAG TPA: ABC transporter permease [Myxococcales bacterium]|jgi:daunorubicin resistance ABC transporter membrane protein